MAAGDHDPSVRGIDISYGDPWELNACDLLPPEAFDGAGESRTDRPAIRRTFGLPEACTGPDSAAVQARFVSCTSGWPNPPSAGELYRAIRSEKPTPREATIIRAWLREATYSDFLLAWVEEAYSWRDLVAAIHRVGYRRNGLNRHLNQLANPRFRQA